jgi:hypothetical protein
MTRSRPAMAAQRQLGNLCWLCRRNHRLKTHAAAWRFVAHRARGRSHEERAGGRWEGVFAGLIDRLVAVLRRGDVLVPS